MRVQPRQRPARALLPLLLLGWLALGAAHLLLTPPGASSDEGAHLVRAVAVVHGDLFGGPPRHRPVLAPRPAAEWLVATSRSQQVPAWLGRAPLFECYVPEPRLPASCRTPPDPRAERSDGRIDTWVGTYPPYAYAVLGLPSLVTRSADGALYAGRVAGLAASALLLWSALRLVPVAGLPWLALGVSASVLSYAAQLNPSGLEMTAAVAVWAALLALRRADLTARADGGVAVTLLGGGAVLVLSRELGLLWLLLAVLVVAPPPAALRRLPRVVPAGLALAAAAAVGWNLLRQPHPSDAGQVSRWAPPSPGTMERMFREYAGSFGFSDVTPPVGPFLLWSAVVVGLVVVLVRGRATRGLVLRWAAAAYLAIWLAQVATATNDLFLVGRYVAPMLAGLFVIAAADPPPLPRPYALVASVAAVAAAVATQVSGVLTVAYRYGHGGQGVGLPAASWPWAPPGGWLLVLAVAALGAALVATPLLTFVRGSVTATTAVRAAPRGLPPGS